MELQPFRSKPAAAESRTQRQSLPEQQNLQSLRSLGRVASPSPAPVHRLEMPASPPSADRHSDDNATHPRPTIRGNGHHPVL